MTAAIQPPVPDFFTRATSAALLERIDTGRASLVEQLAASALGSVKNEILWVETMDAPDGGYDVFTAKTNGAGKQLAAQAARFRSLGCEIASQHGNVFALHYRHANYDNRLFKVDMTTPQKCMAFAALAASAALAAAAMVL